MNLLKEIKNQNLKDFLSDYSHFQTLSDEKKEKYLEKVLPLSEEKQENLYKFLYEENQKEKLRMLKKLNEKLTELSKTLKRIKTKEEENAVKEEENAQMDNLMKEMDEL